MLNAFISLGSKPMSITDEFMYVSYNEKDFFNDKLYGENNLKNRLINKNHVKECEQGILSGAVMSPIIINKNTNVVCDGNHTLVAQLNLWEKCLAMDKVLVVRLIDVPVEKELQFIIDINSHSKNWQLYEIVEKYATVSEDFKKILNYCTSDDFTTDNRGGGKHPKMKYFQAFYGCSWNSFKDSNFKIDDEKLEKARVIRNEVKAIFEAFGFEPTGEWVTPFIEAYVTQRDDCGANELIQKGLRNWNNGGRMQATVAFNQVREHQKKNKSAWIIFFSLVQGPLLKNVA